MGTWKVPYSIPRFTDAEFERMKAEYVAKHGYEVYLPGWEDVVHFSLEKPITSAEEVHWAAKDWSYFTEARLAELKSIKEKRRRQYLRFLGSPQPHILRNRGSLLVAIDNTQDTLSTLSMIIRIAITALPRVFSKLLIGPVGWIMTGADILNLMTHVMTPERSALKTKRVTDSITGKNPFSRKARLARAKKALSGKIGTGAIVEALQTTDQAFGVGISLGAIMNLPFDMFFGNVRFLDGKPVKVVPPVQEHGFWERQAGLAWKSLTTLFTTDRIFDVAEALPLMILSHLTAIAMHVITPTLDPKNTIGDVSQYMTQALVPTKSYLKEIISESGDTIEKVTGWPITGTKFASCTEISQKGYNVATKNFQHECYKTRYQLDGLYCAMRATEASLFMLDSISEPESVEIDYISASKSFHALLNAGYRLPFWLTFPSGFWESKKDLPVSDLPEAVNDAHKAWYLDPELTPEEQFPQGTIRHNIERPDLTRRDSWSDVNAYRDIQGNWIKGPANADVANIVQLLNEYPIDNRMKNPSYAPVESLAKNFISKTSKYLADHDANESTPSTPSFKHFLEDNYGIKLPMNETVETKEEIPVIPLPVEIP